MTTIILFGGRSDERHVSVASAQNIVRTLDNPRDREAAQPRDQATQQRSNPPLAWFWAPNGAVVDVNPDELLAHAHPFTADFQPSRPAIWPDLEMALDTLPVEDPVFLLALHGGEGEDGTVQRMLEARGIPFTGSGSEASAAAFDKQSAKEIVKGRVRIAESAVIDDVRSADRRACQGIRRGIAGMLERYEKIVLKPVAGGSSRGLYFVDRNMELDTVIDAIQVLGVPYIVEQFLSGRELTVGVVEGDDGPFALPVIEIETDPGFSFDYEGKYLGTGTREICPARIPEAMREEVQAIALAAHSSLGCEGYSRSDLIAGDGGACFLELNTLPGLTSSSLVPQELREAGIGFGDFLERQVALARRRVGS